MNKDSLKFGVKLKGESMKFIVLAALFAYVAAQQGGFPIYNDPCSVRSAIVRPEVKTSFSTAAVSIFKDVCSEKNADDDIH